MSYTTTKRKTADCVNFEECGGEVQTAQLDYCAELRRCPACGVLLVLIRDRAKQRVQVWAASGQLAREVSPDFAPRTEAARRYMR